MHYDNFSIISTVVVVVGNLLCCVILSSESVIDKRLKKRKTEKRLKLIKKLPGNGKIYVDQRLIHLRSIINYKVTYKLIIIF